MQKYRNIVEYLLKQGKRYKRSKDIYFSITAYLWRYRNGASQSKGR